MNQITSMTGCIKEYKILCGLQISAFDAENMYLTLELWMVTTGWRWRRRCCSSTGSTWRLTLAATSAFSLGFPSGLSGMEWPIWGKWEWMWIVNWGLAGAHSFDTVYGFFNRLSKLFVCVFFSMHYLFSCEGQAISCVISYIVYSTDTCTGFCTIINALFDTKYPNIDTCQVSLAFTQIYLILSLELNPFWVSFI